MTFAMDARLLVLGCWRALGHAQLAAEVANYAMPAANSSPESVIFRASSAFRAASR
jgi:hypothetical protein